MEILCNLYFPVCIESSKSGVYFVVTAHCTSDQLHFRCSVATLLVAVVLVSTALEEDPLLHYIKAIFI